MATVQSYTKSGVDAKFNSRSNMTMVHNGGGSPDISAYPDSKTGDVIERASDGARWSVVASTIAPIAGRVLSVAGKAGNVTLGPGDVGAAPTSHTHTKAQITDLNASTLASSNSIAQRGPGGVLAVGTPTSTNHATTKAYVDSQVSGGITWNNLSGKPSTFPPSSHTHSLDQIRDLTVTTANDANTVPLRNESGRFSVSDPLVAENVTNKQYVDQLVNDRALKTHTHTSAFITDAVSNASGSTTHGGRLLKTDSSGRIGASNPTATNHVANKAYVDSAISSKNTWANISDKPSTFPPSAHNHTMANITNLPSVTNAVTNNAIVQRTSAGQVQVPDTPSGTGDAASKGYVDSIVTAGATWSSLAGKPSTFTPSPHTHSLDQIRDLTVTTANDANTVPLRNDKGRFSVSDPLVEENVANKQYVDQLVNDRALRTHTHTSGFITDAVSNASGATFYGDRLLKTDSSGRLGAANPTAASHVANKNYVDSQIEAKNTWDNISGKPTSIFPSPHTHSASQIRDLTLSTTATGSSVVQRDSSGRATVATPSATGHATTKAYVDNAVTASKAWSAITDKPSLFPPSPHTHSLDQIRDLTVTTANDANTVPLRNDKGRFSVSDPLVGENVANKQYVDQLVNDRALSAHTHTSAFITDAVTNASGATFYGGRLLKTDSSGMFSSANPTAASHVANKNYVDSQIAEATRNILNQTT